MFSGINKQQPTCSLLVCDFDAKLSEWCPIEKDHKLGEERYLCNY